MRNRAETCAVCLGDTEEFYYCQSCGREIGDCCAVDVEPGIECVECHRSLVELVASEQIRGYSPAPFVQSEADRLSDEISEATRQLNEMSERLERLMEQHVEALKA